MLMAVQEAHRRHKSITAGWLEIANAYGRVHYGLIGMKFQKISASETFEWVDIKASFFFYYAALPIP